MNSNYGTVNEPLIQNNQSCRICLEEVDEQMQGCNCIGTHSIVHLKCLKKWIKTRNYNMKCEICDSPYNLELNNTKRLSYDSILNIILIIFSITGILFTIWYMFPKSAPDLYSQLHYKILCIAGSTATMVVSMIMIDNIIRNKLYIIKRKIMPINDTMPMLNDTIPLLNDINV